VSSFPAGLSEFPKDTPKRKRKKLQKLDIVKEPEKAKEIRKTGSPCEKLLIEKAFPKK
jgi:phage-related protein